MAGAGTRVALDGADAADPLALARSLLEGLRALGRPSWAIDARTYYRDASLRFEYGRTDELAYAAGWLDRASLQREVLAPLGPSGRGSFVTGLRDPRTNRSLRETAVPAVAGTVVIVAGELLLRPELDFDVRIHVKLSEAALRRRTAPESAWTIPTLLSYERELTAVHATIRGDDPRHPAIERQSD